MGLGHGEPGCRGTRLHDLQAGVDVAAVSSEVIQGWMVRIKVVLVPRVWRIVQALGWCFVKAGSWDRGVVGPQLWTHHVPVLGQ